MSADITTCWDSTIHFGQDQIVQAIADTVQYGTWEAHVEIGSVIYGDGQITIFPPAPTAAGGSDPRK